MSFLSYKGNDSKPSCLTDPFNAKHVEGIHIHVYPGGSRYSHNEQLRVSATVEFKNGRTKGEQSFESSNFTALVAEIEAFIEGVR